MKTLAAIFLVCSFPTFVAKADLTMTLSPAERCIVPGKEVAFTGTLTNTSTTDKVFLNDIRATLAGASTSQVVLKSNAFFANVPGILLPGETYDGPLFRVRLNVGAPAANYTATIAIDGGATIFAIGELASSAITLLAKPVDQWRFQNFGLAADDPSAVDAADWDHDGLKNLLEYALQLDPKSPSAADLPPAVVLDDHLAFTYVPSATDVTYSVESSTDLSNWSTSDVEAVTMPNPTPPGSLTFRYKHALSSTSGKVFLRLKITRVP